MQVHVLFPFSASGTIWLVAFIYNLAFQVWMTKNQIREMKEAMCNQWGLIGGIMGISSLISLVVGSVYLFSYWPSASESFEGPNDKNGYCDKTAYMFSFVVHILAWITIPCVILLSMYCPLILRHLPLCLGAMCMCNEWCPRFGNN